MCRDCNAPTPELQPEEGLTRRSLLRSLGTIGAAGLAAGPLAGALDLMLATPALASVTPDPRYLTRTPKIYARSTWAGSSCPVKGTLYYEKTGNVKYLLCHHTENPGNDYTASEVPGLLRGMYKYHTGTKGWPDIAYNFLVDKYGRIWEGRQGSLHGPVIPSATGGNQGYDQIVCWIGSHSSVSPTSKALASMISALAWLADKYHIDTHAGATTSFISRGSNKWPKGTTVTTRTIEGHRVMSKTTCPGDAAYVYIPKTIPNAVTKLRSS